MSTYLGPLRAAAFLLFAAAPTICLAVDTHIWEQSDQSDFARGTPKHLAIRSDGHVTLSPAFQELDSTGVPYLWALARDSKGTLYYAGGAPTGTTSKVFELPLNRKPKMLADLPGLEVHALAVDSQDRVYAAILPDAKVYRIDRSGKSQLFFDPKCKYIWAMAFDRGGNLFVATGDSGIIYKVAPDGTETNFFDTQETHVRSMIIDDTGNLIVGTDPGGLVMRVDPRGKGFVLYQANKREVTAVAEHDGLIYAAAIGSKPTGASVTGPPPLLPSNPAPVSPAGVQHTGTQPPLLAPAIGSLSAIVTGGSELYRIEKNGLSERIWSSPSDVIYAIGFDASGKPIIGTGNKGIIYRIDSDTLSTELLNTPPTQVTAFLSGPNGITYAATGNVGNLYSIGPKLEPSGSLESEVLDAGEFSHWGTAQLTSRLNGGSITLETRSGNLNNPENGWSPWTKTMESDGGPCIQSSPARFLQYRLTLNEAPSGESPEVTTVDIAYLPQNVPPRVQVVEIAPFNYREAPGTSTLERSVAASGSPLTLSLPALGTRKTSSTSTSESSGNTLQYSKGFVTARWNATDPNGDSLVFKVEIRPRGDSHWQTLKDKLLDRYFSFDSAAFPDGEYVLRVTASDAPDNIPSDALTASLETDPFTIDNTPPEITGVNITKSGAKRMLEFTARDALSVIDKAEYSVNGGEWIQLRPVDFVSAAKVLKYQVVGNENELLAVRVFDDDDNVIVKQFPLR